MKKSSYFIFIDYQLTLYDKTVNNNITRGQGPNESQKAVIIDIKI